MADITSGQIRPRASLVLLAQQTASNDPTIDFTAAITSAFNSYLLEGLGVQPASDDSELWLRASQDAGANWLTGATDYGWQLASGHQGDTTMQRQVATDTKIVIAGGSGSTQAPGNASGESVSFAARVYRPAASGLYKLIELRSVFLRADGTVWHQAGAGFYKGNTDAIDGLRVLFESGNIAAGVFNLYGVRG